MGSAGATLQQMPHAMCQENTSSLHIRKLLYKLNTIYIKSIDRNLSGIQSFLCHGFPGTMLRVKVLCADCALQVNRLIPTHMKIRLAVLGGLTLHLSPMAKIPSLCCKNWQYNWMSQHNSLDWMDGAVSNSTTLAKCRSSLPAGWYVAAEMVRGGHSSCYSGNYNIIVTGDRTANSLDQRGRNCLCKSMSTSAECRSRTQHQSWGTHTLSTLTSCLFSSRPKGPAIVLHSGGQSAHWWKLQIVC